MRLFKKKTRPISAREIIMNVDKIKLFVDEEEVHQDGVIHLVKYSPDNSMEIHVTKKLGRKEEPC